MNEIISDKKQYISNIIMRNYYSVTKPFFIENMKYKTLEHKTVQYLPLLISENIKSFPIVGTYINENCDIEDIAFKNNIISYYFINEKITIKSIDGKPYKEISKDKVLCSIDFTKKIVYVTGNENTDFKNIATAAVYILDYINMKLYPERGFSLSHIKITIPKFTELKMIIFKSYICTLLYGNGEENNNFWGVSSFIDNPVTNNKLKQKLLKKGKEIHISFKNLENKQQYIKINFNGEIRSSIAISEQLIEELLITLEILHKNEDVSEMLISFNSCLEEYFEIVHSEMKNEIKEKQKKLILKEVAEFADNCGRASKDYFSLGITYLNIITNALVKLCCSKGNLRLKSKISDSIEIEEYSVLTNFLYIYCKRIKNVSLTEEDIKTALEICKYIINSSGNVENEIIKQMIKI